MKALRAFSLWTTFLAAAAAVNAAPTTLETLMRTHTTFDLTINAPYAEAAPLFGPEGERAWAGPDWNPVFLHPQPAHDEEGAVFTIRHGVHEAVWVNTAFDLAGHHFQYVYFLPGLLVTTIDVRFTPADPITHVHVTYTRTALTSDGNQHVEALTAVDRHAGVEWQSAIDTYFAHRAAHAAQ